MLPPEARWFGDQLGRYTADDLQPLLNLGSQSLRFRTQVQPWLQRHVFGPLAQRQIKIVHSDIQADEGVELVGDLTDPAFLAHLRSLRFRSVICSNLLEHVEQPERIAAAVCEAVVPGGLLFLSVPHRFPYHADPIDTMYRPTPAEFASIFPGTKIVEQKLLRGGSLTTYTLGRLLGSPKQFFSDLLRKKPEVPNVETEPSPKSAIRNPQSAMAPSSRLHLLPWLIRSFQISCLVLRKEPG